MQLRRGDKVIAWRLRKKSKKKKKKKAKRGSYFRQNHQGGRRKGVRANEINGGAKRKAKRNMTRAKSAGN